MVPPTGVDEQVFLTVGERLGLAVHAADLDADALDEIAIPFIVAGDGTTHVIVAGRGVNWVALDVVDGHARRLTRRQVMALGRRVLTLRRQTADAVARRLVHAAVAPLAPGDAEARRRRW